MPERPRIAVIGHVEHITLARVPKLPAPGEIAHLDAPIVLPGGGGGIAFWQLQRGPGEVHLFTALGNDDAAAEVERRLREMPAAVHAARRDEPHTRDLVLVTPDGERTIYVIGEPLHARRSDGLPWDVLASCDAAYFTSQDPDVIREARRARLLVVTARRREALARSGVRADVVVGSMRDPREAGALADYPVRPGALVLTDGKRAGRIETAEGVETFAVAPPPERIEGTYGAGDTFAGALTWYLARGLPLRAACERASVHAAAVLCGINPLEWQMRLE